MSHNEKVIHNMFYHLFQPLLSFLQIVSVLQLQQSFRKIKKWLDCFLKNWFTDSYYHFSYSFYYHTLHSSFFVLSISIFLKRTLNFATSTMQKLSDLPFLTPLDAFNQEISRNYISKLTDIKAKRAKDCF